GGLLDGHDARAADRANQRRRSVWARHLCSFVQPAVGEAVREVVSPFRANDLNDRREELLSNIRKRFMDITDGAATSRDRRLGHKSRESARAAREPTSVSGTLKSARYQQ